jgi:hypothetical protein
MLQERLETTVTGMSLNNAALKIIIGTSQTQTHKINVPHKRNNKTVLLQNNLTDAFHQRWRHHIDDDGYEVELTKTPPCIP